MTKEREALSTVRALKLALEALDHLITEFRIYDLPYGSKAYTKGTKAIREIQAALAQQNEFKPDWDEKLALTEEVIRLSKRIEELEAQPEQEPVAWKLVPIKPTDEMLKAMDECSTEGYDERLYAGHAASIYMAAVDVAPIPPQQNPKCVAIIEVFGKDWRLEYMSLPIGKHKLYTQQYTYNALPQRPSRSDIKPLTDEEIILIVADCASSHQHTDIHFARAIEAAVWEKQK